MDYFRHLKKENNDEKFLFGKYRELDGRHADETQAKSWFMDQVLHPYETQHTLKELIEIFEEMGVELIGTSINHFEPIHNIDDLYHIEEGLYEEGMEYLNKKEYYPGFFYVLGRKK